MKSKSALGTHRMYKVITVCVLLAFSVAYAQSGPDKWANSPNHAWYEKQQLTPATKKIYKLGWNSCCDHGDVCQECVVHRAQDHPPWKEGWYYVRNGKVTQLPPHIVDFVPWTPTGKPVLFLSPITTMTVKEGDPVCLKIPGGSS